MLYKAVLPVLWTCDRNVQPAVLAGSKEQKCDTRESVGNKCLK